VLVFGAEVLAQRPVFCAGYNIGDFDAGPPAYSVEDIALELERLRPVTICALSGSVYGGATDFALVCDIAIAADDIELRAPSAALGLLYHPSGLLRYVSHLGVGATKRAFLTAEPLDAQTLLRVGYVQELRPANELEARVSTLASQIAKLSPLALDAHKQTLNEIARGNVDIERLQERFNKLKASEDFAEGRRAFAERRAPVWKGH
jgi:enoyl-CoA hydratase/carnithine racemase